MNFNFVSKLFFLHSRETQFFYTLRFHTFFCGDKKGNLYFYKQVPSQHYIFSIRKKKSKFSTKKGLFFFFWAFSSAISLRISFWYSSISFSTHSVCQILAHGLQKCCRGHKNGLPFHFNWGFNFWTLAWNFKIFVAKWDFSESRQNGLRAPELLG